MWDPPARNPLHGDLCGRVQVFRANGGKRKRQAEEERREREGQKEEGGRERERQKKEEGRERERMKKEKGRGRVR